MAERFAEIFVEETCGTLGAACALAGAAWLYVFGIGVMNSGVEAVYKDHRWNTGELSFLFQAASAYLILLVVIPVSGAWGVRNGKPGQAAVHPAAAIGRHRAAYLGGKPSRWR